MITHMTFHQRQNCKDRKCTRGWRAVADHRAEFLGRWDFSAWYWEGGYRLCFAKTYRLDFNKNVLECL